MSTRSVTGFLAAADVTGYTAFLTGSELDHAHEIMQGVLRELAAALGYPLRIVKYEGDAILCCASDGALGDAPLLLDVLEQAYVRFADHLFNMKTCTTCSCRACANVRSLDLKLFLHHGEYIPSPDGDVSGPDVILLHRLMKNRVAEATGLRAYLLVTAPALERLGGPHGFTPHEESYESFGAVPCGVSDLSAALEQRREARAIRVLPEEANVAHEAVVSGPPPAVWDCFFDPGKRLEWDRSLTGMRLGREGRGREGRGTKLHCAHDSFSMVGTTLDWKPFRYFTQALAREDGGLFPPPLLITVETEGLADGRTRVRQLVRMQSGGPAQRLLMRLGRRRYERRTAEDFARLDGILRSSAPAPS